MLLASPQCFKILISATLYSWIINACPCTRTRGCLVSRLFIFLISSAGSIVQVWQSLGLILYVLPFIYRFLPKAISVCTKWNYKQTTLLYLEEERQSGMLHGKKFVLARRNTKAPHYSSMYLVLLFILLGGNRKLKSKGLSSFLIKSAGGLGHAKIEYFFRELNRSGFLCSISLNCTT